MSVRVVFPDAPRAFGVRGNSLLGKKSVNLKKKNSFLSSSQPPRPWPHFPLFFAF